MNCCGRKIAEGAWFFVVAAISLSWSQNPGVRKEAAKRESMTSQCVGRFQFHLDGELVVTSRRQRIYNVDVSTVPMPAKGAAVGWEQHLEEIKSPLSGPPPVIHRTFNLEPGVPAVWYSIDSTASSTVTLEAAKSRGDHLFRIVRLAAAGKEAIAETLVRNIMNAYVPQATSYGFCVGFGSIVMEPAQVESTAITLADREGNGVEARVETEEVAQPDSSAYSDLSEEKDFAESTGSTLTVLAERDRTVAGMAGKEFRISVAPPGEPTLLRFTWHFEGVAADATKPKIDIMGAANAPQRARLEAAWETLLGSLHPLPVQGK